ncbi:MAG: hypothetical protein IJI53_07730 [Clostridia bacterium]|nr:hypothetical protein [Clostridia bacterium]MBR0407910.1 hypothetical protein [Clostridia bacterium]
MEELLSALEQAFADYRQDVDKYEQKRKPTDGLLGFGHSLKDEACHEKLDECVDKIVGEICQARPSPADAKRAVSLLLSRDDLPSWPLAAQWMLHAIERHSLPLIPFLSPESAAAFAKEYAARYKPWERLPAQKEVYKALKARAKS